MFENSIKENGNYCISDIYMELKAPRLVLFGYSHLSQSAQVQNEKYHQRTLQLAMDSSN